MDSASAYVAPKPRSPLDPFLVAPIVVLVAMGLVMILSASSAYAVALHHDALYFLKRQALWLGFAAALAFLAYRLDYRKLQRIAVPTLAINVVALVLVLVPHVGTISNGASRWIGFGPVQIEPSEFVKLALVLYLASALTRRGEKIVSLATGVVPLALVAGLVAVLVIKQPDLGTASLLGFTTATMLFVAGARLIHLFAIFGVVAPPILVLVRLDHNKWARVTAFTNPWRDEQNTGYHIIQSLLALGRGGWHGVGLGLSQQKNFWLPEAHTDFIAAIVGEELGFFGIALVVGLFMLFAFRAIRVALHAPDRFGFFLAVGCTALIVIQAFVNLGVVSSSWPVTGVPLPFISFGGSSLCTSLVAVALIANVGRKRATRVAVAASRPRETPYAAPRLSRTAIR